ncbi:MAG TPA: cyclase family protein [Candidatus Methylomirabilis sp.]
MARTRKPRVVDLTRRITHEMLNFPGEARPGFIRFSGLDDLGFRCRQILMPTHFGTHTDAYSHFLPAGRTIDRMAPTQYVGPALVLDVRKRPDPTTVTRKDLEAAWPARAATCRVLLNTGWGERVKGSAYFKDFPGIDAGAAQWLIRRKIVMLGLDLPSVHPKEYKKVHEILFRGGVAVTEGLVNLSRLPRGEVFFVGLPLALAGLDGSPIRAVAIVGNPRDL